MVTYQDVSHYFNTNLTVTAQCEFYCDDGRIRLSWIDTDVYGYTIVGLSAAQEYNSTNYTDTDLTADLVSGSDADDDGIPDTWEELYFSHITNCNPDAHSDSDNFTNYEEYIAGTIPTDGSSYFHITSMYMSSSPAIDMIFNWNAAEGRFYIVKHTDNLHSAYTNLAVVAYPQSSYTSAVDSAEGYYKVEVEVAP